MGKQTLEEKQQALKKQQETLLKKRDKINQELKEVKKKLEDSEKDYLIEKLKEANISVSEAIDLLDIENRGSAYVEQTNN